MADLATIYTLTTPGPDIVFNNGDLNTTDDLYWITNIQGLDGAPIRAPIDNVPLGDGGLVHDFWLGPRHITMEGIILVQSVSIGGPCLTVRNSMEEALRAALESLLRANGTLAWTPVGQGARSLTVRNDIALDFSPAENYAVMAFVFGLVAANPSW